MVVFGSSLKAETNVNSVLTKGNEFASEKKYAEAIEQYKTVLQTDPQNIQANLFAGLAYANLNKFDEAIQYTQKSLAADPSYAAYYNLGLIYAAANQPDKALSALEEALKINPESYMAEYQKGIVYTIQKDYEGAAKSYQRSIELNPDFEEAHIGLAGAAYKKGDQAQALNYIAELKSKQKDTLAQALEEWIKKENATA